MRIHSNTLSATHIINAAHRVQGVGVGEITRHGSRSRKNSFDVFLTGHSLSSGQWGNASGKTASWDDWGMVLAELYLIDPKLTLKPYPDVEEFVMVTQGRFLEFNHTGETVQLVTPDPVHHRHRWLMEWHDSFAYHYTCKGTKALACTAALLRRKVRS